MVKIRRLCSLWESLCILTTILVLVLFYNATRCVI